MAADEERKLTQEELDQSVRHYVDRMNRQGQPRNTTDEEEVAEVRAHFETAVGRLRESGADVGIAFAALRQVFGDRDPRIGVLSKAVGDPEWLQRVPAGRAFTEIGRSWATGADVADLPLGLSVLRYMLHHEPSGSLVEARVFAAIVHDLLERGRAQRDAAVLREAVRLARDAVGEAAPGTTVEPYTLWQLAECTRALCELTGDTAALVEAVNAARRAVARTPYRSGRGVLSGGPTPGFPYLTETEDLGRVTGSLRGRYLVSLAESLLLRHDYAGEDTDLREARAAAHEALDVTPEDDPHRASYQLVLARALALGYAAAGRPDDLDDAVSQAELGASADGGARLGHLLRERFLATGDPRPLHRAVRALNAAEAGGAEKTAVLATVLATLYEQTGDSTLLERAVALHREAVAATHERDPARPVRLCGLADALVLWAERRSDLKAFREAVGLRRAALTGHPDQVAALSGLARTLHRLSLASADATAEADEARLLALNLVRRFPDGHPARAAVLAPLAPVLATRIASQHGAADADLERAITVSREATAELPATDPERPRRVMELGVALTERLARTGRTADRAGAIEAFADAAHSTGLPTMTRCLAAREQARLTAEAGDWAQAASAYDLAVTLLPQVAVRELRRDDQEFHLTSFARLASDAAAALLRAGGTPDHALSLLEGGRGVLLTQAIESTGERAPALEAGPVRPGGADGPVVVVNASVHGCQALIVTGEGTRVVPLPDLTHQDVVDRSEAFTLAVEIAQDPRHKPDHQLSASRFVGRTLGWLWDVIAEPVLDALPPSYDGTGPLRRVWWMPTGALSFLPLHAAGHHDGSGRTVMDRAISSYTPTLRMLHRSRAAAGPASGSLPRMPLVVSMPTTPGAPALPGVAQETSELMRLRPGAVFLETEDATREATLAALATSSWVHFACHAVSDPAEPSASHLVLEDGPLTVMDIARLRIEHAGLAYLSACSTARGGARLADEAIHIGSAFQLAGYPHVVATLWPIADNAAATVAAAVYAGMGEGTAAAVHAATRSLRDACNGKSPLLWASHIHIGA